MLEHKLSQSKLVEVLRQSPKFHYETKTGTIKFKEKADRNILIIRKLIKDPENLNEIQVKEQLLLSLISECNQSKSYLNRIKKIEKVQEGFHVVFDHEDVSQNVEKFFNERLKHEKRVLISSIIKEDRFDFIEDFLNSEIILAAESLRRRVVNSYDVKLPSMWQQVQRVNEILLNPTKHLQRRYTQGSKVKNSMNLNFNKNKNSAKFNLHQSFDEKNFNINVNMNNNCNINDSIQNNNGYKHSNSNENIKNNDFQFKNLHQNFKNNNFAKQNEPIQSNSMKNTLNRNFIQNMLIFNNINNNHSNNNKYCQNSQNNINNQNQGYNKFDLVDLKQTFENYRMPQMEDFKPHRNSDNPKKPVYRASFAPSINSLNLLEKNLFDRKRMSTFSNLSCEPVIEVQNTKEYDRCGKCEPVDQEDQEDEIPCNAHDTPERPERERVKQMETILEEENLLKKNLNFGNFEKIFINPNESGNTTYTYSNNEIVSVFFHMNFLKVFQELPEDFKDNPLCELVRDKPRTNLVTLMPKRKSIQKYIARERSKTLYNQNAKDKKRCKNNFIKFLVSSANKPRVSFESTSLRKASEIENSIQNRKRNTSSSVKINKRLSNY